MNYRPPVSSNRTTGSVAGVRSVLVVFLAVALVPYALNCKDNRTVTDSPEQELPLDSQWVVETAGYPGGQLQIMTGFDRPYGIAVQPNGALWVPDLFEGRVVRFTPELRFNGWLGKVAGLPNSESGWHYEGRPDRGTEIGMFNMAHSVDFDQSGTIVVADYMNSRIYRYSPDGTFLGLFFDAPAQSELAFAGCPSATYDAEFNLWVADFDGHRIYKFAPDGSLIGWIGERAGGQLSNGFATDGLAQQSTALGGFHKPHMVRVDSDGNVLVVETGNNRVQKFSPAGLSLGWFGALSDTTLTDGWIDTGVSHANSQPGGFYNPVSLRLIADDTMLIADNGNHRIQKFSSDGRFVGWLGGRAEGGVTSGWNTTGLSAEGSEPGMFASPFDVVQHDGKLYVADGHNGRIQIFDLD